MGTWENESFCQQARLDWAKDGGHNTKFYQAVIKEERRKQVIQMPKSDGLLATNATEIRQIVEAYFSNLFQPSPYHMEESLFNHIQPSISMVENNLFFAVPTGQEIHDATRTMFRDLTVSLGIFSIHVGIL